jgi:sulfotransferase family protein
VETSRLPNLIMAGPGKAGTTSLFWYLSQHPSICEADVKEIRFFAPITHHEGALPGLDDYARHFDHCGTQEYRLEASPQYFHGGQPLITAMKSVLLRPRIIITLRDPVDRLWSVYRSLKVRRTLPESMTFDSYVSRSQELHTAGDALTLQNRAYWTLSGEFYVEHLRVWLDAFDRDLKIVFFEALADDPVGVVRDICGWLQIDDQIVESFSFTVENQTVENRSRILHRIALSANREGLLRDRRRLKAPLRRAYYRFNRMPQRERMSEETKRRLEEGFATPNASLAQELRGRGYEDLPAWLNGAAK